MNRFWECSFLLVGNLSDHVVLINFCASPAQTLLGVNVLVVWMLWKRVVHLFYTS